ncbi:hypothetical protein ANG_0449 [Streptococcus anginosus subsp. whileyi MAS624]|nr:hypothetical protein ANG_0449 [Streptococcus anginosus subsp. whileyi MAS624]
MQMVRHGFLTLLLAERDGILLLLNSNFTTSTVQSVGVFLYLKNIVYRFTNLDKA